MLGRGIEGDTCYATTFANTGTLQHPHVLTLAAMILQLTFLIPVPPVKSGTGVWESIYKDYNVFVATPYKQVPLFLN